MKLAAIDIGSNAVKLQITKVLEYDGAITFKRLEYIRFPLRLGQDVFSLGRVSAEREANLLKLLQTFRNLMDLYEIDHYYACATSAMREARNNKKIQDKVHEVLELDIEIISGKREAEMINNVIALTIDDKAYLHIDVGGGSTELNLYVNKEKIKSESFRIGSVRSLELGDFTQSWRELLTWISRHIKKQYGRITAIGTGGSIKKIYELSGGVKSRKISIDAIQNVQNQLKRSSMVEKLNRLHLNPDRADVILPASDIYVEIMKAARSKSIYIPDVGLKDGINYYLFEKYYQKEGKVFVKN